MKKTGLIAAVFVLVTAAFGFINDDRPGSAAKKSPLPNLWQTSDTGTWPQHFEIGRSVTNSEISKLNISIKPDGSGLPAGSGAAATGRSVYEIKCMVCHGKNGSGGIASALVAVMGDTVRVRTIGNYWPYATTLFDYIRRAMPFNQPGSLTNNEVYGLTAYLLFRNRIISETTVMNAETLPRIVMPARHLFVTDDRRGGPEVK